jgi:hypothetical protein
MASRSGVSSGAAVFIKVTTSATAPAMIRPRAGALKVDRTFMVELPGSNLSGLRELAGRLGGTEHQEPTTDPPQAGEGLGQTLDLRDVETLNDLLQQTHD